jgi:predicted nucleotidyltransferase
MNISEEDKRRIVEWACKRPEIRAVYLFGSRARGTNDPDSDIDLGVRMFPTSHDDSYNVWWGWHERYKANPDLHLSHEVHLEWYEKDAGLERVGKGVERDGKLLYSAD